jgi:hypothetical protein
VVFGANVGAGSDEHLGHARVALACCHHERSLPAAKSAAASDGTQPSRSVHGPTRCCPRYGRRLQPRNVRRKRDPCANRLHEGCTPEVGVLTLCLGRSKRTGLDARHRRQVAAAPAAKVGHFAVRARSCESPHRTRDTAQHLQPRNVAGRGRPQQALVHVSSLPPERRLSSLPPERRPPARHSNPDLLPVHFPHTLP